METARSSETFKYFVLVYDIDGVDVQPCDSLEMAYYLKVKAELHNGNSRCLIVKYIDVRADFREYDI